MPTTEPTIDIDERFSSPGATARSWADVVDAIQRAEIFWLSTVRRDGRPHVTPLPATWLDGALHFGTGPEEQKAVNLAANAQCVLTTGSDRFRSGFDIVLEGKAVRVTDRPQLERLAAKWRAKIDWPFEAVEGGFRDPWRPEDGVVPDPAEPQAHVFGVSPTKVLAFSKGEPFSQTRYRFPASA